jgi:hypothetical protein
LLGYINKCKANKALLNNNLKGLKIMQSLNKTVKIPPHLACPVKRANLHPLQFIRAVHLYLYNVGRNPVAYSKNLSSAKKHNGKNFLVPRSWRLSSAMQGKTLCTTQYKQAKGLQTKSLQFIIAFFTNSSWHLKRGNLIFTKLQGRGWLTNGGNRYCLLHNYISTLHA